MKNNKIIVILGPTASGKSDLAIKLARKFNGEIISADSRQIYRHADLATGKITPAEQKMAKHYLIDIASLRTNYNAAKFQRDANYVINYVIRRGKLPIICGGTGFWIKALVDNVNFPEVKPNWKLRAKLNKFSAQKLFAMLKKLDTRRAENIDAQNKVRLIRAIEICKILGSVPKLKISPLPPTPSPAGRGWLAEPSEGVFQYNFLQIGISISKEKLHSNIQKRLKKRLKMGMIKEVENLHQKYGASWKRLESLGLEFRWIARFLQHKISRKKMEEKLFQEIKNYAKRQMTWFQKDKRILWFEDYKNIEKEIKFFNS